MNLLMKAVRKENEYETIAICKKMNNKSSFYGALNTNRKKSAYIRGFMDTSARIQRWQKSVRTELKMLLNNM